MPATYSESAVASVAEAAVPSADADALQSVDAAWAWAPYQPDSAAPWDLARAAHLYRRAAFGPAPGELKFALEAGPQAAVERLSNGAGEADELAFYEQAERMAKAVLASGQPQALPPWWLFLMLRSPRPLLERLTLHWHGHFATSGAKVKSSELLYQQNQLLRRHALGKFGPLLHAMARDGAMLWWLDSASNKKRQPNENFAREIFELFSLGLGNYSEQDVKEAARAFTGWELRSGRYFFNAEQHDDGPKTVLGQTGRWGGDDVIRIVLQQPACGQFIVSRLARCLIRDVPLPPHLIAPLASEFVQREYDLAWLTGAMLQSNLFFSPHAMAQRIKSPVELAVGLLRTLDGTTNFVALAEDLRALGHDVFFPPNVKGWDGGLEWINASALLARTNLVWSLASGRDRRYGAKLDLPALAEKQGFARDISAVAWFSERLLANEIPAAAAAQLAVVASGDRGEPAQLSYARLLHGLAALPEFQLA